MLYKTNQQEKAKWTTVHLNEWNYKLHNYPKSFDIQIMCGHGINKNIEIKLNTERNLCCS